MNKLKVTAYKKTGKYYTEETHTLSDYPSIFKNNDIPAKETWSNPISYCHDLWNDIVNGNREELSPVTSGFSGYIFVFDLIVDDSSDGFLNYLLDRTEQ